MSTPTMVKFQTSVPSTEEIHTPTLANESETPGKAENTGGGMGVVDPIPDETNDTQDTQPN